MLNFGAQFLFWVAICIPPRWRHYSCNKCIFWPLPTCLLFCNVCCERALQLHLMHLVAFSPFCFCLFFCHVLREGIKKLYWMHLLGFSLCLFVCLFAMCRERVKEKGLVVGKFSQLLRYGGWSTNSCSFWQASTFRSKRCASKTPSSGTSVSCEIHMHVLERISQHTACKMLQFLAEELDNITNVGLGPMVSYCQAARIVHKTKLLEQIEGSQMHWRVSATTTYLEELDVTKAVDELWRIEGERKLRGDGMMRGLFDHFR